MTSTSRVKVTKSGVVLTWHDTIGSICFSPYTGLIAAVHDDFKDPLESWLEGGQGKGLSQNVRNALGVAWSVTDDDALYPVPALLPQQDAWTHFPALNRPILMNWFITGRCPLDCLYCYAEDLMRDDSLEPSETRLGAISKSLLSFNPLVVVLTGGDPIFSPHLEQAMRLLLGKAGIIVDTSGHTLTDRHVALFKEFSCSLRISIDATRPRVHDIQRPLHSNYPGLAKSGRSSETSLRALEKCLSAGIGVTVQTVATKKNANDLISLGDVLFRLGVRSWRIFKVAPGKAKLDGYEKLVGSHKDNGAPFKGKRAKGPYGHAFRKVMQARCARWQNQMTVQVISKHSANSVILISPDGRFLTESNTGMGKVLIDEANPRRPRMSALRKAIDMNGHAERYLNLTSNTDG